MAKYVAVFLASLLAASTASAHTLEIDGTIGAIMHVDPGDQPSAQSLATFDFEMKDTAGRFAAETCDCTMALSLGGEQFYSERLYPKNERILSLSYVFPTPGVYTVKLTGAPAEGAAFQPFELTWDLRVEDSQEGPGALTAWLYGHIPHLVIAILGAAFVLGVIVRDQIRLRRKA